MEEAPLFVSMTVAAGYEAGDPNPYTVERVPVTAPVTGRRLRDGEAEGLRISGTAGIPGWSS